MSLFHPVAVLLLAALGACATVPAAPAHPDYYVMRHLQKETIEDTGPDPRLTDEAHVQAGQLALWFDAHPPSAIYVSNTRRARETAESVAARHGVTLKVYDPSDTAGLIARVRAESGTVLIVGHSNTVPDIVAGLGGKPPPPLAETDYGDIWHVWGEPRRTMKLRLYQK
jgi:phosphohistidine phosphatase SixA